MNSTLNHYSQDKKCCHFICIIEIQMNVIRAIFVCYCQSAVSSHLHSLEYYKNL